MLPDAGVTFPNDPKLTSIEKRHRLLLNYVGHAFCHGHDMRFLLITWTLLGATMACTPAAFSSEDRHGLQGRWELVSVDLPIALRDGESVAIEDGTITVKRDCNDVTLSYSIKGDELSATPMTTTLVACHPPNRFADEYRMVYEAVLHSRYQIDGDVLRLFSLKDSALDYRLEFHRVR